MTASERRRRGRPRVWAGLVAPAMNVPGASVRVRIYETARDARGAVRRLRSGLHALPDGLWIFSAVDNEIWAMCRPAMEESA